jgi:hypothetical protein
VRARRGRVLRDSLRFPSTSTRAAGGGRGDEEARPPQQYSNDAIDVVGGKLADAFDNAAVLDQVAQREI